MRLKSQIKFIVKILTVQIMKAYWMILLYQTKIAKMTATFYRNFNNCQKFHNQQKNVNQEIDRNEDLYFGQDGQPEMFAPEKLDFFQITKKWLNSLEKLYCVFHLKLNQIAFFHLWFMRSHI